EDFDLAARLAPQFGEERVARCRTLVLFKRIEIDADRDRDALAADNTFAVAQRRDRIDEAARALGHRGLHELLVAFAVEAHRNDRAALREYTLGKVGRALGNEPQRHTIFTALLGDPLENLAHRLSLADVFCRNVTMRFFAHEEDRALRLATRPDGIVESQARQHRDHDAGDVRGHPRYVDEDRKSVV